MGTRGAMMVAGIFQACFMVGVLYYVSGVGETIVLREQIQDATDSGAFASAALQARGLNQIGLLNVLLSAALAILAAVQTIIDLCTLGITIARACSPFCAPAIPPLTTVRTQAEGVKRAIEEPIRRVTSTIDKVSKVVAISVPGLAAAKVFDVSLEAYGPTAGVSFSWPSYRGLPIKIPSLRSLCNQSAREAVDVAMEPIESLGIPGRVLDPIRDAVESYARAAAFQFCYRLPTIPLPSLRLPVFERTLFTPARVRVGVSLTRAAEFIRSLIESEEGRLEIDDDARMGEEPFQVRVVVAGHLGRGEVNDRGVRIALWNRGGDDGAAFRELYELGRVNFAGSEYYYNGREDREEWLVHMQWGSRLRRFRPPLEAPDESAAQACGEWGGGGICGRADEVIERLGALAIH